MLSILLGCCGLVLALVGTSRYGIGYSSDALAYISAAQGLHDGRGLQLYNGQPYLGWPPLYPVVIAALTAIGLAATDAARFINATLFGILVALTVLWADRLNIPRTGSLFAGLLVLFGVPMLDLWRMAYSELLFIALVTCFLWLVTRWQETGRLQVLLLAALAVGAACLTRYAGIAALLTGGLLIMLDPARSWPRRVLLVLLFGGVAVLVNVPWVIRNATLVGAPSGIDPVASPESVGQVILMSLDVVGAWFLPDRVAAGVRRVAATLPFVAAILTLITTIRRERPPAHVVELDREVSSMKSLSTWILTYTAFLVASRVVTFIDSDHSRLLAPIYVPLVLVVTWVGAGVARGLKRRGWHRASLAVPLLALAMILWPARFTIGATRGLIANGAGGYATTRWQRSELLRYLQSHPIRQRVYSNEPNALYAVGRLDHVRGLPDHDHVMSPMSADSALRRFRAALTGESYVVLFFRPELARNSYSERELLAVLGAAPLLRFDDGAVYSVSSSGAMRSDQRRLIE